MRGNTVRRKCRIILHIELIEPQITTPTTEKINLRSFEADALHVDCLEMTSTSDLSFTLYVFGGTHQKGMHSCFELWSVYTQEVCKMWRKILNCLFPKILNRKYSLPPSFFDSLNSPSSQSNLKIRSKFAKNRRIFFIKNFLPSCELFFYFGNTHCPHFWHTFAHTCILNNDYISVTVWGIRYTNTLIFEIHHVPV